MNTIIKKSLVIIIVAVVGISCSTTKPNKVVKKDVLTDANIAAIVVGANTIDISAGSIALKRSNNNDVKEFANRMIVDHKSVLASAVELVTRLGVTPVNNDLVFNPINFLANNWQLK